MDKASVFFSVVALFVGVYLFKVNMDISDQLRTQSEVVQQLKQDILAIKNRPMPAPIIQKVVSPEAKEGKEAKKAAPSKSLAFDKPIKVKAGYMCARDGDFQVAHFNGKGRLKFWEKSDGTKSFTSRAPDASGDYKISGEFIFIETIDAKGYKIRRRVNIVEHDKNYNAKVIETFGLYLSPQWCKFN